MTQIAYVGRFSGILRRMLAISDCIELPPSFQPFFCIGTENELNATSSPCILFEELLVTGVRLAKLGLGDGKHTMPAQKLLVTSDHRTEGKRACLSCASGNLTKAGS